MCEYLILVVKFCQNIITVSRKSVFTKWTSTVASSITNEFKTFETNLGVWINLIEAMVSRLNSETNLQTGNAVERTNKTMAFWKSREQQEEKTNRARHRKRILDCLSPHQRKFEDDFRHERSKGDSSWITEDTTYKSWKTSKTSSIIWVTGILGSGKTVLMANMVDQLQEMPVDSAKLPIVAYFFCRYKVETSLRPRNILGGLVYHLCKYLDTSNDESKSFQETELEQLEAIDSLEIVDWVLKLLPHDREYFVVLDSLEECLFADADVVLTGLRKLSDARHVHICCSTRHTKQLSAIVELASRQFPSSNTIVMASAAREAEMRVYIERELQERQRLRSLPPEMVQAIKNALVLGAQGM